jgi:hypothetical protein
MFGGKAVQGLSEPTAIRFTSDQGIILTGPGDRYKLAAEVVTTDGHRKVEEELRWRSSDPSVVSVSAGGTVTAHAGTGSAVITVSAAGAAPQAAQVMVARPAPGTVLVPTGAVLAAKAGQVTLRRTSLTSALKAGQILVSNGRPGGGLLARVVSVSVTGQAVSVVTEPASLARAFTALSVHAASAPVTTSVSASAVGTVASLKIVCKLAAGLDSVSLTGWGVSVPATITLDAALAAQAGVVDQFRLAVRATLPVTVNTGTVVIGGAGKAEASCELPGLTFALPTPVFLGPVELTGDAMPTPGVGVSFDGGAGLALPGPVLSDTVTAFDGISYTAGRGWQPVDDNSPGHITIGLGGQPSFTAWVSAGFSLYVNTDFDVGGAIVGQELAGSALAFAKPEGDYTVTVHPPFARLAPGYTGPGWDASLHLTAGPEVKATGGLAKLLSWLGVDSPKVSWPLFDRTFPVAASPTVTAAAVPGSPASRVTRLSVSVPPGYGGDKVEFIQYPTDGGPGHVIATAAVTGLSAAVTWTHTASATGTTIRALVYGPPYGTAGYPYATAGTLTVPGLTLSTDPNYWANSSYTVTCPGIAPQPFSVTVHNGQGHGAPQNGFAQGFDVAVGGTGGFATGDLTGDGQPEVALVVGCHPSQTSPAYYTNEVQIFTGGVNGPKLLARLTPPFPASGLGNFPPLFGSRYNTVFEIRNGVLVTSVLAWAPGDCHACASINRTVSWHWNGKSFVPSISLTCPNSAQLLSAWNAAPATVRDSWAGVQITGFDYITCWNGWVVAQPISPSPGNGLIVFSLTGNLHLITTAELQQTFTPEVCSSPDAPPDWKKPPLISCN